ncbi:MAG: hypothetical protein AVDCRST_MAG64-1605 [uncultured Phycisphaerae bacterium]|uniref:Uncharacterized protein n=1 Tax=uncultured Phycisphaerae bacterium TaxID=904963 RepID=A0A6J4NVC3_9BACT|nr:MAG: hypothetical protein AVDCRST_MAG64-1605 [uncultured Phycisphaerae bacterium]
MAEDCPRGVGLDFRVRGVEKPILRIICGIGTAVVLSLSSRRGDDKSPVA